MSDLWKSVKLSEIMNQIRRTESVNPLRQYRLVGIRLDSGGPFHRETKPGSQIAAKYLSKVNNGDFIYSRLFAWRGAFGVIGPDLDECYVSAEFPTFKIIANRVNVEFLLLWFRLPTTLSKVKAVCTGSTPLTRNRFKENFLLNMEIPLPALDEQRLIVTRNEKVSAKIEETSALRRQAIEHVKKLRQSILEEAFFGKLVPQSADDESASELLKLIRDKKERLEKKKPARKKEALIMRGETPYELPKSWLWCRFSDITTLITDGKHGDCRNQNDSGYYFLSAKDIVNGKLDYTNARQIVRADFEEVDRRTNLQMGDILLSNTGSIGKIAVADDREKVRRTTFQKSVAIIKLVGDSLSRDYIAHQLRFNVSRLMTTSQGTAQKNLLLKDLKDFKIALPPLSEQKRIAERVNQLMLLCDSLEGRVKETLRNCNLLPAVILRETFRSNDS
jgi:restriction endonuclease S subunit